MTVDELKQKAPISTAFAREMREVFGDVKLIRVREGDVVLGKPDTTIWATCFILKKKREQRTHKR